MYIIWNLFFRNFLYFGCFIYGMEIYCNFIIILLKMFFIRFLVKLVVVGCFSFRLRLDLVIKKDFKLKISFYVFVFFNLIN